MAIQVRTATSYNGEGHSLSILTRQFISFSYGGRHIEEFDLLATFANDRLEKTAYAEFSDTTTEQAELDGQMFWMSAFRAGSLTFTLSTDGITVAQLEDFKNWFAPGEEKELILSEHHNRAILARIASAPQISLLPFKHEEEIQIGTNKYPVVTSLYKGDIVLEFVMDDPHWYSKLGYITTATPSKEELKIILEDGVPHKDMIGNSCFLPEGKYCTHTTSGTSFANDSINLSSENNAYLYYCGTAPAKPIVSFSVDVNLVANTDTENKGQIRYANGTKEFYLSFGTDGTNDYTKMVFGLPSVFSSYNNAISIAKEYLAGNGKDIFELRTKLHSGIYDYLTRRFVMSIIESLRTNTTYVADGAIKSGFYNEFVNKMKTFIQGGSQKMSCVVNCKTGEVSVTTQIREQQSDATCKDKTENAGNMVRSKYLSISTRNKPNNEGKITTSELTLIKSDVNLYGLSLDYKYMFS